MPSIRTARPNETDAAAIRDELARALIHLIQAGCAYADDHPESREPLGRAAAASFLAGPLGRGAEDAEGES
jgi:hypothetical protein